MSDPRFLVVSPYFLSSTPVDISKTKAQFFLEGHKSLRNLPHGFDIYLVNIKTMRKIVQIFIAFSEKLNFTWKKS